MSEKSTSFLFCYEQPLTIVLYRVWNYLQKQTCQELGVPLFHPRNPVIQHPETQETIGLTRNCAACDSKKRLSIDWVRWVRAGHVLKIASNVLRNLELTSDASSGPGC